MIMKPIPYILIVFFLLNSLPALAQQEEVKVVKPYDPTLSGAEKIQLLPDLDDSVEYKKPAFEYTLFPKRYDTEFSVSPIKPARMVKTPLEKLYKSQLTLGMGNYLTPLAELRINQLRSSNGTFGVLLRHHSMNGKVKLANDARVDAGFNENRLNLYGKRFLRHSVFEYEAGAEYDALVHYGVDTAFSDTVSRTDFLHRYYHGYTSLGIESARADSFHLQYKAHLDYHFFSHALDQMEHQVVLDGNVDQILGDFRVGADLGGTYAGHPGTWDSVLTNHFIIKANPYISKSSEEWRFMAGLNTYTEIRNGKVTPRVYLRGKFQFNIVKEVLVPYFGVDGFQEANSYREITGKNPFISPDLVVTPASHRIVAYGGLKGRFSDVVSWNLRGTYSVINDQYFFVTDSTAALGNQFSVVYDDMNKLNLYGGFKIMPTESLDIILKGNYYHYQMVREDHPWYHPAFDATLQGRYNIGEKIYLDASAYLIGPRHYPAETPGGDPGKLNTTLDLNLSAEYRYTNLLSFWVRVNNITARPYYLWHRYPSYRFRFMAGFTYGL